MSNIKLLDQNTINKIAAGEVIERPAAVVKELIENAIDAGANAITAEIKDGGISFIRITDNGVGINKDDIKIAFLRHATSKIKTVEDLLSVSSLGFRGEALSSIASVAQVELVSKTSKDLTGTRYLIEGGEERMVEDIGCPNGTTFLVRNLFYNTPARRKFLKSDTTEASYIGDLIERLAVSHPNVSFKFITNNKIKLHTSGNGNLKDIVYHVYGRDITKNLLEIDASSDNFKLHGFIGKPIISRGNRNYENYFINGRYIKSGIINKAIEEAYKPYTMMHRYPFTALHFQINSELIDVNVHPTKMEIRFKNNDEIYRFTHTTLSEILSGKDLIPNVELVKDKDKEEINKNKSIPEPFETNRINELRETNKREANNRDYNTISNSTNLSNKNGHIESNKNGYNDLNKNSYINSTKNKDINLEPNRIASLAYQDENLNSSMKKELVDATEIGKLDHIVKNPELVMEDNNFGCNNDENVLRLNSTDTIEKVNPILPNIDSQNKNAIDQTLNAKQQTLSSNETTEQMNLFEDKLLSKEAKKNHRIVGQVFSTYWIIEYHDKMFLIDQHAAHEKVLYEKIMNSLKNKDYLSQMINPPIILTLSMREEEVFKKHIDILESLGFEIEYFGGKEYSVRAVPSDLFGIAQKDLLIDLIDELVDDIPTGAPELILEKVASMSCKAAVKGNNKLSYLEAEALIDQLLELENPYNCPHGRPTIISMSKYEIEKKFKRII